MSSPGDGSARRRVRVTSPRSGAPAPHRVRRPVAREIDDQTELGEVYLRSLLRAQLRLALGILTLLAAMVGSLPLLFHLFPALAHRSLLGMPLSWVLIGFGVYPLLLLLGWAYLRRAERNERAFTDMVAEP